MGTGNTISPTEKRSCAEAVFLKANVDSTKHETSTATSLLVRYRKHNDESVNKLSAPDYSTQRQLEKYVNCECIIVAAHYRRRPMLAPMSGSEALSHKKPLSESPADSASKLDPREEHFFIPGPRAGLSLFLRRLSPAQATRGAVLYVHGATFPSALSIAYRFGGQSWRDALCAAGFDVWGFDFYGFGHSDRYPQMNLAADKNEPLCVALDAAAQIEAVARFILSHVGLPALSVISHSWGSMPVGCFACAHPTLLQRWVLFGPIAKRVPLRYESTPHYPAWRLVSAEDQWNRFVEDVPAHETPVLSKLEFEEWAQAYLDTDPESRTRTPPSVKTPLGPFSEIIGAWHGVLPYDPSQVRAPIAIIRGEWDGLLPDIDARWLFDAFSRSSNKRDIKIARGTHLMHLETMRWALWRESVAFLSGDDVAPIPPV